MRYNHERYSWTWCLTTWSTDGLIDDGFLDFIYLVHAENTAILLLTMKQSQVVPGTPFCDVSKIWWRHCRSRSCTILPHGIVWRNGSWFLSAELYPDSQLPAEVGCHKLYLCERSSGGHRWACNTHTRTQARTHACTHTHAHENKSFRTTDSPPTEEAKKTGKLVWAPLEVKYLFEKPQ